jgi:hypothetical protein
MAPGLPTPWRAERRNHEAELLAERERHDQAVNAERQRAHESVEREREIAAGERQYLMRQTDEIRQAAKASEAVLKEQLQEAKAFAESFQARAGRAESEAAFWRGKAEAAAEESSRWQRRQRKLPERSKVFRTAYAPWRTSLPRGQRSSLPRKMLVAERSKPRC